MSFWFNGTGVSEAYKYEADAKRSLQDAIISARRDYDEYAKAYVERLKTILELLDSPLDVKYPSYTIDN
jgi:outer membrane protein TolC